MKSQFTPIFFLFVLCFFLVSNSSNPPDGRTGAPGETTCNSCHDDANSNNFEGTLSIEGLPDQITPNATYTISVITTKTGGNPSRAGFQLIALDEANKNAGTLTNPSNSSILKNSNNKTYFEHNPALDFQENTQVNWTVDWTAPATVDSKVTFYANAILGDNAGNKGDLMISANASATVVATQGATLSVTMTSKNVSCFDGSDGFAAVEVTGGKEPYTFSWSNESTESSASMLTAGSYMVTILDSEGSSKEETISITEPDPLSVEITAQTNVNCENAIGSVVVTTAGGTPGYTYSWRDMQGATKEEGQGAIENLDIGEYVVTVTDANACIQTQNITIEENTRLPQVNAGPRKAINCNNTLVNLEGRADEGSGIVYSWSTNNGSILDGASTLTPIVETGGIYTLLVTNEVNGCSASSQVEVSSDLAEPIANAGTTKQLSCAEGAVTLDGTASSTGDNITYQWTTEDGILNNSTAVRPTATQRGLYTLTVLNTASGCSSTSTVNVIQDINMPTAEAGITQQLDCTTGKASLNGNGSTGVDFVYFWETEDGIIESGENTLNPVVIAAGTYTLTVLNRTNNCDASSPVVVTAGEELIANAGADVELSCANGLIKTLNGNQSSTGRNVIYDWTTEDGSIISDPSFVLINIDAPGAYTLTVRDTLTNCIVTDRILVNQEDTIPRIEVVPMLEITCEAPTVVLQADASDLSVISYQWATDDGNIIDGRRTLAPVVDAPGTYTLGVINTSTGCVATASVVVTQEEGMPTADINTDTQELDCNNSSIVLNGSSTSIGDDILIAWTTDIGNIVNGATTLTPTINVEGTYTLSITNTNNGCTTSTSIDIFQTSTPPALSFGASPLLGCSNLSIQLSATVTGENLIYEWTTENGSILSGGDSLTPTVDAAGDYTLVVTDNLTGCKSMGQVSVQEDEVALNVQIEAPEALSCKNTITLNTIVDNTADLTYLWSTETGNIISGKESPNPVIDQAGTYDVLVTDNINNCVGKDVVIVEEVPPLSIRTDTVINNTATVFASGGVLPYTYRWNTEPVQTSVTANNLSDGEYEVTITDAVGCSITNRVAVGTVSVPAISSLSTLDLYPNPANDFFTLTAMFSKKETGHIHIFNSIGEKIWTRTFDNQQVQLSIETSTWNAGIYFMMFETEEGIKVEEFAVMR